MTQEEENILMATARKAMKYSGNIVEIGLGHGENTLQLLKLAKEFDKKVIGIDPFDNNMPESYRYSIEDFYHRIVGYEDYLILHRRPSQCKTSWDILEQEICFAFVDGLQYAGAVMNDLYCVEHSPVIVADDYNRISNESQVCYAVDLFKEQTGKKLKVIERWAILTA